MIAKSLSFDNKEVAILQLSALFDNAQRQVRIYTPQIDFSLWAEPDVLKAMKGFLLASTHNQLELIQINSNFSRNNPWVQLAKRLSRIKVLQISQTEAERLQAEHCFAFADRNGVFIQQKPRQYQGYCSSFDARSNQIVQQHYLSLRKSAQPCQQFITLMV